MAKRPEMSVGLAALQVNKRAAPTPAAAPDLKIMADPPLADITEDGPGLTLYLKRNSYLGLKSMALAERTTVHALLVEAVQKLFDSRHSPAVALAGNRPGSAKRNTKTKSE